MGPGMFDGLGTMFKILVCLAVPGFGALLVLLWMAVSWMIKHFRIV
jgi:hypothetical protein